MISENIPVGRIIYEKENFNGQLKTRTIIRKNDTSFLNKGFSRLECWKLVIYGLLIAFLTAVLISAIIVLLTAQRPGLYLENCKSRSCESALKLKCLNNTCACLSEQYYLKGCKQKKSVNEECTYKYECKSNMICSYGKCSCETDYYWSGFSCTKRKTFGEYCTDKNQCIPFLECFNGLCSCDSYRFWTGYECKRKSPYGQVCKYSANECLNSQYISCINNKCLCNDTYYYYNISTLECQLKKNESDSCIMDYQCLGNMTCLGVIQQCGCPSTYFFDNSLLLCLPKTLVITTCQSTNRTCRTDLGLSCQSNLCLCDSTKQFWYNSTIGCVDYFTYSQSTCFENSNCLPGSSLFCNLNVASNLCNCPTNSIAGMCDCVRVNKNESYWDSISSTCSPAIDEWSTCNYTYQCMSDMYCNSTIKQCQCDYTQYFDIVAYLCVPKTLNNTVCSSTNTCRSDLGLSCQSNLCQCNTVVQFWTNSSIGCINYLNYGELGCSSNSQCSPGKSLFCNLNPTINSCNCNKTSVSGMCDCVKVIGNESYWDYSLGVCKPGNPYDSACSMDYECRTLTEKTYCSTGRCLCVNGTATGIFKSTGICSYCPVGWKSVSATGKCYGHLTGTSTCGQKSYLTCISLECNKIENGSSLVTLPTSAIFNQTISALQSFIPFGTTGTFIGGYFDDASNTWKWDDGSAMSTTVVAGQWNPSSVLTGLNSGSNNVCLMIETSSTPIYFTNALCNSPYKFLCERNL